MKKLLSGLCALALAGGMVMACNRTETERIGTTPPDRTSPSASPGTPTTPGSSDTTGSSSSSSSTTTDSTTTTSPSGGAATTTPGGSSSSSTTK